MTYVWQRWIADELRDAGLTVIEVDGWKNRGRPASTGHFDPRGPTTTHHTGSTTSSANPNPTLRLLIAGRSDLPGPLCHVSVDYRGRVFVVAAGRANHAGRIGKSGVVGMPLGADGNALALGDEVDTNGTQDLPAEQRRSIAVVNAVFLRHFDKPPEWCHRHADISGTGKWDIGNLTTRELRQDAADALEENDMPSAEEIARAVWREKLDVVGKNNPPIPAGRMLAQAHNRADVRDRLKDLSADLDAIAEAVADDATREQVRKVRQKVNAVEKLLNPPEE